MFSFCIFQFMWLCFLTQILHLGRPLAYELALELEKRFGDAAVSGEFGCGWLSEVFTVHLILCGGM